MSSPFFAAIEWDSIYERMQDGPWLPELPQFYANAMRKASLKPRESNHNMLSMSPMKEHSLQGLVASPGAEHLPLVFSPAPMERYTPISDIELAKAGQPIPSVDAKTTPTPGHKRAEDGHEDGSEEEDDDEEDEEESDEEELHIRDSVFVTREDIQNRLPDWSYIDAEVLMNYLADEEKKEKGGAEGTGGKTKKKKHSNKVRKLLEDAKEARDKASSGSKRVEGEEEAVVASEPVVAAAPVEADIPVVAVEQVQVETAEAASVIEEAPSSAPEEA